MDPHIESRVLEFGFGNFILIDGFSWIYDIRISLCFYTKVDDL